MKARRTIYLIIGTILIVVNLFTDLIAVLDGEYSRDISYSIGYFIGSHILMIFGLILIRMAFKIDRKIKNRKAIELEKDIDTIGKKPIN